jgi:hypothetical protein
VVLEGVLDDSDHCISELGILKMVISSLTHIEIEADKCGVTGGGIALWNEVVKDKHVSYNDSQLGMIVYYSSDNSCDKDEFAPGCYNG